MMLSPPRRARSATVVAAVVACAGLALPASSPAGGFDELRITFRAGQSPAFLRDVRSNCAQFYVAGIRLRRAATTRGAEEGTLDIAGRRGEARALGAEWQIGKPSRGRGPGWLRFSDLGVRLDGSRAFVTAIVNRSNGVPRGPRRRIAVIRGVRIESGLMNGAPSTNRTRISGRMALLAPMSRAIQRTPCRGRTRRPVRTGYVAGEVRFEQRPERASGLEGTAELRVESGHEAVAVEPTGGIGPSGQGFGAPITAGLPVPMVCNLGTECFPSGGTYTLGGGFDLVHGAARASVTNIAVSGSGATIQEVAHTITGTLDGAPVTIVDQSAPDVASGWTEDFARRVSASLGVEASGRLGVLARFTRTGPAT